MDISQARSEISHLTGIRTRREPLWRDLSKWLCPWRGLFDGEYRDEYHRQSMARFTNAASSAVTRGASGMTSGMTPRNIAWFKPCFVDPYLEEVAGARQWLDEVDRRMKDCLADGGFYQAIQAFNMDLIWSGCALLYTERQQRLRYESVQIGTFCVARNRRNELDTVARLILMSAQDVAQEFSDKVSDRIKTKAERTPWEKCRIWQLVRNVGKGQKPFVSWWWEEGGEDFLRTSGYYEMPFFYAVWNEGETVYGTGPGDECLADARQMDLLERHKLAGLGKLVNPPIAASPGLKDCMDLEPGGINYITPADHIAPILDLSPYAAAIRYLQEEIQVVARRLENGLMATLFASTPLENRPRDMSATEFLERKREALQQLGPVISAYEPDVLTPLLYRTLQTLDRAGLTPPPPEQLAGMPLLMKIDFISPMANALRQTGVEATRSLLADVAQIAQTTADQSIFDKIDLDQAIDTLASGIGAPGAIIRADEDVAQMRQSREQEKQAGLEQMRQQQQLEQLAKMAEIRRQQNIDRGGEQWME